MDTSYYFVDALDNHDECNDAQTEQVYSEVTEEVYQTKTQKEYKQLPYTSMDHLDHSKLTSGDTQYNHKYYNLKGENYVTWACYTCGVKQDTQIQMSQVKNGTCVVECGRCNLQKLVNGIKHRSKTN
jgi:hypothetical protein